MSEKIRVRIRELQHLIPKIGSLRTIYRLGRRRNTHGGLYEADYVVNIKKNGKSFLERVADFDAALRKALVEGEDLRYDDQTFLIVGPDYRIRYVFEGYKKQCDKLGYIENGRPQFRMLHRMGVALAFRHYRMWGYDRAEVESRMFNGDWMDDYPNPADRYVAIRARMHDCEKWPQFHDLYPISDARVKWLLGEGEGTRAEFKSCTNGVFDDTFETVCSFLNRNGGDIILGVNDHGQPIGIAKDAVPSIIKQVADVCNNRELLISERGSIVVSPLFYNHRHLIHIHVSEGRYAFYRGERYVLFGDSDRALQYGKEEWREDDMAQARKGACHARMVSPEQRPDR